MVGGGRHHTPLPSEDVRRGRSTHTLPPFWPAYNHTLPSKTLESSVPKGGNRLSRRLPQENETWETAKKSLVPER